MDKFVNQKTLSYLFGISGRMIRYLTRDGILIQEQCKKYNLKNLISAFVRYHTYLKKKNILKSLKLKNKNQE